MYSLILIEIPYRSLLARNQAKFQSSCYEIERKSTKSTYKTGKKYYTTKSHKVETESYYHSKYQLTNLYIISLFTVLVAIVLNKN